MAKRESAFRRLASSNILDSLMGPLPTPYRPDAALTPEQRPSGLVGPPAPPQEAKPVVQAPKPVVSPKPAMAPTIKRKKLVPEVETESGGRTLFRTKKQTSEIDPSKLALARQAFQSPVVQELFNSFNTQENTLANLAKQVSVTPDLATPLANLADLFQTGKLGNRKPQGVQAVGTDILNAMQNVQNKKAELELGLQKLAAGTITPNKMEEILEKLKEDQKKVTTGKTGGTGGVTQRVLTNKLLDQTKTIRNDFFSGTKAFDQLETNLTNGTFKSIRNSKAFIARYLAGEGSRLTDADVQRAMTTTLSEISAIIEDFLEKNQNAKNVERADPAFLKEYKNLIRSARAILTGTLRRKVSTLGEEIKAAGQDQGVDIDTNAILKPLRSALDQDAAGAKARKIKDIMTRAKRGDLSSDEINDPDTPPEAIDLFIEAREAGGK